MKNHILASLLLVSTCFGQATTLIRKSDPLLNPSMDAVQIYRGNNYELQVKMTRNIGLSTGDTFTLYANTNSMSVVNYFSNLVGRLSDSNTQTVVWTLTTNDTLLPAQTYYFEGIARNTNVTTIFRANLQVVDSLGSSLPNFAGPWGGPAGSIYISGAGWIPYAGPGTYENTLTNQQVALVSSPTNFIAWKSNNFNGTVAYWWACLTNGGNSGSSFGGTNIINVTNQNEISVILTGTVVTVDAAISVTNQNFNSTTNTFNVTNYYNNVFSNFFNAYFTNFITLSNVFNVSVSNNNQVNVGNVNVDATVTVTNFVTLTNIITVTNFISIGDTYVTVTNISTNSFNQSFVVTITNGIASLNGIDTGGVQIVTSGWGSSVYVTGSEIRIVTGIPTNEPSSTLEQQLIRSTNGIMYWGNLGALNYSVPGTNITRWANPGSITTNQWIWPAGITNAMFDLWGAAGARGPSAASGAGAHVRLWVSTRRFSPGTVIETINGDGGPYGSATSRAFPQGGRGTNAIASSTASGGAFTAMRKAGETNWFAISAGGGAAAGDQLGGNGGATVGGNGSGNSTNCFTSYGARANDYFGSGAVAGSNFIANANAVDQRGGDGAITTLNSGTACGGGGAGYKGGAGGGQGPSSAANTYCSGAGGICWVDLSYVDFAVATRSVSQGTTPDTELPQYTSGRGNSPGTSNTSGQGGCSAVTY